MTSKSHKMLNVEELAGLVGESEEFILQKAEHGEIPNMSYDFGEKVFILSDEEVDELKLKWRIKP